MTHITLTTVVVFFAIAAFGAIVFALAHFASHGAFCPPVQDDDAPEEAMPSDATEEGVAAVQHPTGTQDAHTSFGA